MQNTCDIVVFANNLSTLANFLYLDSFYYDFARLFFEYLYKTIRL